MASPGTYKGKTINAGTDSEVARQIADIDAGISSETLGSTRDMKVPAAIPGVPETAGALGAIGASTDAFTKGLAEKAKQREAQFKSSQEDVFDALLRTEGETTLTDRFYKDTVDPAEAELTDINQQLIEEQRALENALRDIEDAGGGTATGQAVELNRVKGESLRRQADLSIIQMAKQGKYDSAKKIADRAVAAQLEQQKQRNDLLSFIYTENKDLFDKSEQRLFETQQAERERELDNKEYRLRAEYDQKIKESDPLYGLELRLKSAQAREAELKVDALQNPDPSGVDADTLGRIEDLTDGARTDLVNAADTIDQLTRVKELVANNSTVDLANPTTEAGRLYQRLTTDIADKMARERTGAVVRDEEQRSFKTILGVGFGNQILATPEEINRELDKFINKHETTTKLIDPTGKIREYIGSSGGGGSTNEESYLDGVVEAYNDPYADLLSGMNIYTP